MSNTHCRSIDVLRSDGARRRREEREAQQVAESGRRIDEEVVDVVRAETVRSALATLPETERAAIELSYFGGHTYQVTAVRLGEAKETVKSSIRSGLKSMRATLPGVEAMRP